jgi:hypothetical protein
MKRLLIICIITATALSASAQNFRIGLGGGFNSTWLANSNVSDQGDDLDFAVTFGGSIGIEGVYGFNEKSGISIAMLYSGHNQKYEGEAGNTSYESTVKMRYLDIPILFRITSPSGTYFEVGPQVGFLMSADEEGDLGPDIDVKDSFEGTNIAGVLGFGVDIDVSENVIITTGLRLGYGFTDATSEYSSESDLDAALSEGKVGTSTYYAHYDNKNNFGYEKTNRIFGGLKLGVTYNLK